MACCVLMAAFFGLVAAIEALFTLAQRCKQAAQEWRLMEQEDGHG